MENLRRSITQYLSKEVINWMRYGVDVYALLIHFCFGQIDNWPKSSVHAMLYMALGKSSARVILYTAMGKTSLGTG